MNLFHVRGEQTSSIRCSFSQQIGLTFIELLIVMFIISILVAISVPAYLSYTSRAKVTEALSVANVARRGVDEFWTANTVFPEDNSEAGIGAPAGYAVGIVDSITIGSGGVVTIQLNDPGLSNGRILLTPVESSGGLEWRCSSPDIRSGLLPGECR